MKMAAEGEKVEKVEKALPKDAQVIAFQLNTTPNYVLCLTESVQVMVAILKDMGINDFEPRVINQMLEFSYRYSLSYMSWL